MHKLEGWSCDFCGDTDKDNFKIEKHEKTCEWNPAQKSCRTCKNLIEYCGMLGYTDCEVKSGNLDKKLDDGLSCKDWEELVI